MLSVTPLTAGIHCNALHTAHYTSYILCMNIVHIRICYIASHALYTSMLITYFIHGYTNHSTYYTTRYAHHACIFMFLLNGMYCH